MRDSWRLAHRELSGRQLVRDGSLLSGLLGALVLGSLYYLRRADAPPAIPAQEALRTTAQRQRRLFAVPFLLILLGGPLWSTQQLQHHNRGWLSFWGAFLHAYTLGQMFNLFDLVVLDYLVFVRLQPAFAVVPGTMDLTAHRNMGFHGRAALKGVAFGIIPSLVIAGITRRVPATPPIPFGQPIEPASEETPNDHRPND
jgi:hypothetical protein